MVLSGLIKSNFHYTKFSKYLISFIFSLVRLSRFSFSISQNQPEDFINFSCKFTQINLLALRSIQFKHNRVNINTLTHLLFVIVSDYLVEIQQFSKVDIILLIKFPVCHRDPRLLEGTCVVYIFVYTTKSVFYLISI